MSNEYRNEQDIKNNTKINELLNDMPEFLEDFHTHLDSRNRSTNTIFGLKCLPYGKVATLNAIYK